MIRLGNDLVLRFPRRKSAAEATGKEWTWLPRLAPSITLEISKPIARGEPGPEFPWHWAIYHWIEGRDLFETRDADLTRIAIDLGTFVNELHAQDPGDGPKPGRHNSYRGVPLSQLDEAVRRAIGEAGNRVDGDRLGAIWDSALLARPAPDARWIHGDLMPTNLIAADGALTAIIDWGQLGVGDPAADYLPSWHVLTRESRRVFRDVIGIDDDAWQRSRGWSLFQAILALPYYWESNAAMVDMAQRAITQLLADE